METKKWLNTVSFVLVIIGAINLGIFGVVPAAADGQGFDVLQQLLGFSPTLLEIVYVLIGLSGIYQLVMHVKEGKSTAKTTKAA